MMRLLYLILLCLSATPGWSEQIGGAVTSDLDGDGVAERYSVHHDGDGIADLHIETIGGPVVARDIVWVGGIGQQPELSLAANGSVRLASMNEAIGRSRWRQTLTVAYRNDAFRVAGFTYDWYDTLDLDDYGSCDLNLLSGRGVLEVNGTRADVRTDLPALAVTEWKDDRPLPAACGRN